VVTWSSLLLATALQLAAAKYSSATSSRTSTAAPCGSCRFRRSGTSFAVLLKSALLPPAACCSDALGRYVELRIIKKDAGKTATVVIQRRADNPAARPAAAPVKPEPQPPAMSRSLPVSRLGSFDDGGNHAVNAALPSAAQRSSGSAAHSHPAQAQSAIPGDHCGVGMMMAEEGGNLKVMGLVPGGPADKSHAIQKGDLLVEIDGKSVVGRSIVEVRPSLLGPRGSSITIGLARTPGSRPVRITLIRDKPSASKPAPPPAPAPYSQQMPQSAGRSSCVQQLLLRLSTCASCLFLPQLLTTWEFSKEPFGTSG
jgi:hypothetical protein